MENSLLSNDLVNIIVTAIITGLFTFWLTGLRENKQIRLDSNRKLLIDVYDPIIKVINEGIWPTEGYDGLDEQQTNKIVAIISNNEVIADSRLLTFRWALKEHQYINRHNSSSFIRYDLDKKFLHYAEFRYQKLRKLVYLPYDKNYIGIGRVIGKFKYSYHNYERRIIRKIKRNSKKNK